MEWTRDKTLLLIEEYCKRRGLWDLTNDDYRKKNTKKELLEEIAAKIDKSSPVAEIEKKFHTLRTQYHREISRMNQTRGNENYKSKWFAFKHLQFLSSPEACRSGRIGVKVKVENPEIKKKKPSLNSSSPSASEELREFICREIKSGSTPRSQCVQNNTQEEPAVEHVYEEDIEEINEDEPSHNDNVYQCTTNKPNKSILPKRDNIYQELIFEEDDQTPTPPQKKIHLDSQSIRDEFTVYGEYIANEMRFITSREILATLKHKINTAMYEANLHQIQKSG